MEVSNAIYTSRANEPVKIRLRKLIKNCGSFPSDEALLRLFCLVLRNIGQ